MWKNIGYKPTILKFLTVFGRIRNIKKSYQRSLNVFIFLLISALHHFPKQSILIFQGIVLSRGYPGYVHMIKRNWFLLLIRACKFAFQTNALKRNLNDYTDDSPRSRDHGSTHISFYNISVNVLSHFELSKIFIPLTLTSLSRSMRKGSGTCDCGVECSGSLSRNLRLSRAVFLHRNDIDPV